MGKIKIEKVGDRIWLKGHIKDTYPMVKDIHGASFRGTDKVWTYGLDLETCRALRRVFGDKLVIGPDLTAWAREAIAHAEKMGELGRKMDDELLIVPKTHPKLAEAMAGRTYQRSGARFVATGRKVLIADEPSLGKTILSLGGIIEAGAWKGSHLVIAPKTSLSSTWARQIGLWTPDAAVFAMPEGKAARAKRLDEFFDCDAETAFLVVNPAMLRIVMDQWCEKCNDWMSEEVTDNPPEHYYFRHKVSEKIKKCDWPDIINYEWDSIIVDECHEHFAQYKPSNATQTMEGLARLKSDIKIALTGTPIRGHEKKLWGTLKWLGVIKSGQLHTGYWKWIETWLEVDKSGYGWTVGGLKEGREEAFYKHIDTYVRRLTKKEARPDLPDKEYNPVWVALEGKHRKQHQEFLREGEIKLSGQTIASIGALSELTRLKQLAFGVWDFSDGKMRPTGESPKIEWLIQALKERGVSGKESEEFFPESGLGYKYVIASQFTEIVHAASKALNRAGIKTLVVAGDITGKRRDETVKLFQSDDREFRVLLLNTKTGGVSIDLDAHCDEMFILDETWIADDQVQLEGRIDNRSGRVAPRTFHYIRTEGTIEEEIAEGNYSQDQMQKMLLDSRRGVETAIRIIRKLQESSKK